jgi:CHAT domain-containing protein/tetratricopeptide (TPR) repeat protein
VPAAWLTLAAAVSAAAAADPFAACAARFAREPAVYESSYCFFQVAQQGGLWDEAARRLDALAARHPANFWLTLARGNVEWTRDLGRAERFYRAAAEGFASQRESEGEVLARYNLRTILYRAGRTGEAGAEVERVMQVAEASGRRVLLARAFTLRATHLTDTGRDLDEAYRALRRADESAGEDAPYTLRRSIVFGLGNACFQLGRFDEALGHYRRVAEMTRQASDTLSLATALYSEVNTRMRALEELPRPGGREEVAALARAALRTADASGHREIQVLLHRTLGELSSATPGAGAEAHFRTCIALAREIQQPRELGHCLWSLARHLAERGRAGEARRRLDEAQELARGAGDVWSLAHAARHAMRVGWLTRPRDEALAESLLDLDAIEAVHRLPGEDVGAEVLSTWARDYYWVAGRLLDTAGAAPSRPDLERAFEVVERMRARVLLETLTAARGARAGAAPDAAADRHQEVLRRIVEVHRELLAGRHDAAGRRAVLERLDALELERDGARRERDRRSAPEAAAPRFARLAEVETALAPDEALLSFVIGLREELGGDFGGGAWVMATTRAGTTVHPVPDRVRLHTVAGLFLGLFEGRDGREAAPAAGLYRELLAPALETLPAGVTRLVVVPDDALHRLPFAALRPAADAAPLASRYEITLAPSASLWLRWRLAPPSRAPRTALVLADPALAGLATAAPAAQRGAALALAPALGPLPHARAEGRAIVRALGGGAELWTGEAASEHALKSAPLSQFAVVHFAAHAVVDDEQPERSAVFLSAGSAAEDGLLQSPEVADLPLQGRAVVLSACRSASGAVLRGEGLIGLGRSFFRAGSPAVVGSLWPLRDDEAAALFTAFYRALGRGAPIGAALREAQLGRSARAAPRPRGPEWWRPATAGSRRCRRAPPAACLVGRPSWPPSPSGRPSGPAAAGCVRALTPERLPPRPRRPR